MRVAVIHHTLSSLGGGERVGASLIEALNKHGIHPDVYTTSPTDPQYLQNFYGKKLSFNLYPITPFAVRIFGIYQRLLTSFHSFFLTRYDVVVNTTGVYTPLFMKNFLNKSTRYILYVYNPLSPITPFRIKESLKYKYSIFWKIYFQPYISLVKSSISKLNGTKLLAVSNFTNLRISKYWGKDSITVYPPVDIKKFSLEFYNKDRDGVITIGRFSPEKQHLLQLNIAKRLCNITFRICGSAKTPYYRKWFNKIKAKAEEWNLKNIEFYPNISLKKLISLIGESKFFLHTMRYEDFGLTTCEAIAGGCIPCVHNSGGQIEVVPFRRLRFNTIEEAIKILKTKWEDKYRYNLLSYVQKFDEENFQTKMLKIMEVLNGE